MSFETLDPPGAKERLDSNASWILLDVRTVEEFEAGHGPGAYNIPLLFRDAYGSMAPNADFMACVERHFDKDSKLVLACAAGIRSAHACELLGGAGYGQLVNMDGGFSGRQEMGRGMVQEGWAACGLPVEMEAPEERRFEQLK